MFVRHCNGKDFSQQVQLRFIGYNGLLKTSKPDQGFIADGKEPNCFILHVRGVKHLRIALLTALKDPISLVIAPEYWILTGKAMQLLFSVAGISLLLLVTLVCAKGNCDGDDG